MYYDEVEDEELNGLGCAECGGGCPSCDDKQAEPTPAKVTATRVQTEEHFLPRTEPAASSYSKKSSVPDARPAVASKSSGYQKKVSPQPPSLKTKSATTPKQTVVIPKPAKNDDTGLYVASAALIFMALVKVATNNSKP